MGFPRDCRLGIREHGFSGRSGGFGFSRSVARARRHYTQSGMSAPLCFVLMPFGVKKGGDGTIVDFDRVYADLIAPAVADANLAPLRADQETNSGIIHKPMFERLILCPFAVADLTQANANVYYELGVRHAFRPASTIQIMSEGTRLPFDIQMLRTIPYKLLPDGTPDPAR